MHKAHGNWPVQRASVTRVTQTKQTAQKVTFSSLYMRIVHVLSQSTNTNFLTLSLAFIVAHPIKKKNLQTW